jgi:hypothetical protein
MVLYRRTDHPGSYCVVRRDEAPPAFLATDSWEVAADPVDAATAPDGLNLSVAREVVQAVGFYVFVGEPDGPPTVS